MRRSLLLKLALSVPLIIGLLVLDHALPLQGLPLLGMALVLGLLVGEVLRPRLVASGRTNLAGLPFTAAALVLLLAYCKGRDITQLVLFVITVAVVLDILMVALTAIGEVTKRGLRGLLEFAGLTCAGLVLGLVLSLILVTAPAHPGAVSLAGP